jgi:hypothetical protein
MSDEVVDTTEAPAEGAEPTEPTEPTDGEPTEPAEPVYATMEELQAALEKSQSSIQSWLGRRDKETLTQIGAIIDERLAQQQNQLSPDEISSKLLDNPRETIRSEFEAYENERNTKNTMHINTAMETVGNLMESDPLYADKDLGNEVVAEIKGLVQAGKVSMNVPAEAAGKVILADALSNVMRKRSGQKKNPLGQNAPGNTPGGITPPAAPPASKKKMPKLDDITSKMAEKWGYSQEDLDRLYGS